MAAKFRRLLSLLAALLVASCAVARAEDVPEGYVLDRVVVLSRSGLHAPASLPEGITTRQWLEWTVSPGELSYKGGALEAAMGRYFRQWLDENGLFSADAAPGEGETRFFADGAQRAQATARQFASGLFPEADLPVERPAGGDENALFASRLRVYSDDYADDALAQIDVLAGEDGLEGYCESLQDAVGLLMSVTDMEQSEADQAGTFGDLLEGLTGVSLKANREPALDGPIDIAATVAEALLLQYREAPDATLATFGPDLTPDDWRAIASLVDARNRLLFTAPLIAVNASHPLLAELGAELADEGRRFSFLCGHASNLEAVLSALSAQPRDLPDALETAVPTGAKLVFERWLDEAGAAWFDVSLVYPSAEQLLEEVALSSPPVKVRLDFEGMRRAANGLIAEVELLGRFDDALDAYGLLEETYAG